MLYFLCQFYQKRHLTGGFFVDFEGEKWKNLSMKSTSLPKFLYRYFWDIDARKLNPQKHSQYVIQRLLELGDIESVRWVRKNFSQKQIKETLCETRQMTLKTANFWSLLLGVNKKRIKCLQKDFRQTQRAIWHY